MPQSYSNILLHLVFSTKNREPLILPNIEAELHRYMTGIFKQCHCPALLINGTSDHIHSLCVLDRSATVAALVESVKTGSSKWIKTKGPEFHEFYWQKGYGVFSIGQSNKEALKRYTQNQKEHHGTISFQGEFRTLCQKYGIKMDERHAWD
jgi:REP element-mobilizing transposase RayT